jgi:outer membrane protein assembly factor BamB
MRHFTIDKYRIDINAERTFTEDSVDNVNHYDFVYFDESEYHFPSVLGIRIYQDDTLLKSAVIGSNGGGIGIHDTSAIVENDRFLVCCSNSIFCLSIPDLTLLWRTQADQATCFEIYKYHDSYIIHGELEISRLDKDGKILWQQSGADIFTTVDGKDSFVITDTHILVTDWENRKYKFDFNGQSIL